MESRADTIWWKTLYWLNLRTFWRALITVIGQKKYDISPVIDPTTQRLFGSSCWRLKYIFGYITFCAAESLFFNISTNINQLSMLTRVHRLHKPYIRLWHVLVWAMSLPCHWWWETHWGLWDGCWTVREPRMDVIGLRSDFHYMHRALVEKQIFSHTHTHTPLRAPFNQCCKKSVWPCRGMPCYLPLFYRPVVLGSQRSHTHTHTHSLALLSALSAQAKPH